MNVFKGCGKWSWQPIVKILMMSVFLLEAHVNELIGGRLVYVVSQPRQVEFVHTEADKVKQGLNVIDCTSRRMHIKLPN